MPQHPVLTQISGADREREMIPRTLFNEDHEAFRATARRFFETEIAPYHEKWEEQQHLDRNLWNKAGELGLLGLGYPGGPALSRMAEKGDPAAFKLPRPLLHSGNLDFSFAGLKTAVLTQAKKLGDELEARKADLAASTEAAIVEVLVKKTLAALKQTGLKRVVVAGGVGANRHLRAQLNTSCAAAKVRVHYPELHLCTDNGAMIAMAAAMRLQAGQQQANTDYAFDVKPRWPLDAITV